MIVSIKSDNLERLTRVLRELQAECIAVPPFEKEFLERGFAVHFRCQHPEAQGSRMDVMSVLRGVDPFDELWTRRTTVELEAGLAIELLAMPDLVKAKKTQHDKDWPMIRRLVEAHYLQNQERPNSQQTLFWLRECRTESILMELAQRFPAELQNVASASLCLRMRLPEIVPS